MSVEERGTMRGHSRLLQNASGAAVIGMILLRFERIRVPRWLFVICAANSRLLNGPLRDNPGGI
jgi:hypothetical protein